MLLESPTPLNILNACWLSSVVDFSAFEIDFVEIRQTAKFIRAHVDVFYNGERIPIINCDRHHISLFSGKNCGRADVSFLAEVLRNQDWKIGGPLAQRSTALKTSMRLLETGSYFILCFVLQIVEINLNKIILRISDVFEINYNLNRKRIEQIPRHHPRLLG